MTDYRLVAADLDGTLRAEREPFSPRVLAAIQRAQDGGVHVVMATGRMYLTALPFARELGLRSPIVCDQGATIREWETNAVLFKETLPVHLARQIHAWAPDDLSVVVCMADSFYAPRHTDYVKRFVGEYHDHLHIVPDLAQSLDQDPEKIVFVNDIPVTSRLLVELSDCFGKHAQVVQSYAHYVEITHPGVSKGKAVEWLAQRWGIAREQVIAIGDQDNDRSMIEWAGLGVAIGNAVESVKAIANYIAPSASEDGVADVIERFVLK